MSGKRRKCLIGWVRRGWYRRLCFKKNGGATLQVPSILKRGFPVNRLKQKFVKVQLVVKEL